LAFLRREGHLTRADYRRLNPSLDSAEATRQLADIVRQGLLRQHGAKRWTSYTLPAGLGRSTGISESAAIPVELPEIPVEPEAIPIELSRHPSEAEVRRGLFTLCLSDAEPRSVQTKRTMRISASSAPLSGVTQTT
jgi:hypothetical protein